MLRLLLCLMVVPLFAAEDALITIDCSRGFATTLPAPTPAAHTPQLVAPGRARAKDQSKAQALRISWDDGGYETIIAIEAGAHLRRRAWVATIKVETRRVEVAYAGSAFLDSTGELHIDCQRTPISGPLADQWSPDSFAIRPNGQVRVIDDADRGNPGSVIERIKVGAKGAKGPTWEQLLGFARVHVLGRL